MKIGARRSRYIQLRIRTFQYLKLNSKLDGLLGHLKYAAKINVFFGFVMENIEDSHCQFVYPPGKKSLLEKNKLLVTGDDLKHFKAMIASINDITACPRGMFNTKWQFWKLTNVSLRNFTKEYSNGL